jgi:inosose dehydratase
MDRRAMTLLDQVAGAPISWGVCEVADWGRELPPSRVLAEMRSLGLTATELGPDGYLPADPAALRDLLDRYGLRLIAGFVPVVLHQADQVETTVATVSAAAARLSAAGAEVLVVAATGGNASYDRRSAFDGATRDSATRDAGGSRQPALDGATQDPAANAAASYDKPPALGAYAWDAIAGRLGQLGRIAADAGLALAVHPHVGTVIERPTEVDRLLERTGADLCLDTGHLAVGGSDPLDVVRRAGDRVRHVHLKDVDALLAAATRSGRLAYHDAVRRGLYRPLGHGDVPITQIVTALEEAGYRHWYVLEQDVALTDDEQAAANPTRDAHTSLALLRAIERQLGTAEYQQTRGK